MSLSGMFNTGHDVACFADCDDFMLGDALLVAPVVQASATSGDLYLPAGPSAWVDLHTGEPYQAGRAHTVAAPSYTLPLFARAGAEIPVARGLMGRHRHDDPVSELLRFGE